MPDAGFSREFIYAAAGVAIVLRFAFRELRERKMRLGRLFIAPVILGVLALILVGAALAVAPEAWLHLILAVALAVLLGFGIGSAVGHFTTLRLGERSGYVAVRGSAITVAIWIGAVALRLAVRLAVPPREVADTVIANAALLVMLACALFFVRYRIFVLARLARAEGLTREMTAI